jgi:hypothetical protein
LLDGLCTLLRNQNFAGIRGVFAVNAVEGTPRPHLIVKRSGGESNETFEANDRSLISTDVDVAVRDTDALRAATTADLVLAFLDDCWPVTLTCAGGSRQIVGVMAQEPDDDGQAPQDGSDNWDIGSRFSVTIQHSPA